MNTATPAAMKASMKAWRRAGFPTAPFQHDTKVLFSKAAERYHGKCTTAPEQVDALWKGKFADCNGGIKCAAGFVIADVDARNGGIESAQALGLLDAHGLPTGGAYAERTGGGGWRIIYTLPDGLGRGLKHAVLAPGIELFFEDSQAVVIVAPSVVNGRPYVALSDSLTFTAALACIVDFVAKLQAERAPKPRTITPNAPNTTPQSIKSRYMAATLLKMCDELRSTLQGSRYNTLRKVALIAGSKCAATDYSVTEAARQLEAATAHWTNQAKVKAAIATALATGASTPAVIDWKHDARETFQQAGQLVRDWLNLQTWNGAQESSYGRVSRSSTQTIAIAMADYGLSHGLYGAFTISVRTLMQLTGCCWQTLRKGLDALRADGTLAIVGRDEYAFIKANGTDAAAGDKRLQARCYQFNLAEIGRQIAKADSSSSTVRVQSGKGKGCASYELHQTAPITVLLVRGDTFSKLALGRSASAVLTKLLANSDGLNDAALAALTGLHVDTVGRAVGRLLMHGLVDCEGELTMAVDADAIQAALADVASDEKFAERHEKRERIILAERAAHSAYVQARRAGMGEADAQRLYAHVYNVIAHPEGQQDTVDTDGVITPANVTPTPIPGDDWNAWEQHRAIAQAKRDAANKPTLAPKDVAHAMAVLNAESRAAQRDTERPYRILADIATEPLAYAAYQAFADIAVEQMAYATN